jgi:hypothetical protein
VWKLDKEGGSMSGGVEPSYIPSSEFVKEVMKQFSVDEKTAERIIAFANNLALQKMDKWVKNYRKRQKEDAEYIYQLTKRLKKELGTNNSVIDEIEKKVLEMVVNP